MPAPSRSVLIVEDHLLTRRFLADNLAADGFEPREAGSLAIARREIGEREPSLVVLDLSLPDGDGLGLIDEIRRPGGVHASPVPLIVLSGRGGELDRIRGLDRGADDYLVKPFSFGELRARIEALLRRAERRPGRGRMRIGELEIDPLSREVWVEGAPVHLSGREYGFLLALAGEPTRVFTREELMRDVWEYRSPGISRTLDSHAHRLRRKLGTGRTRFIVNVWGVGYRLLDGEPGT